MSPETVELRRIARQLLADGTVEVVIGYGPGTADPLAATPLFVRDADQADRLVFDATCEVNLVNYLHQFRDTPVALVVKGCDERSVVGLLQEKQVSRERIVLIGAPCRGVIDPSLVSQAGHLAAVASCRCDGELVEAIGPSGKTCAVPIEQVLHVSCSVCPVRNPRFADHVIGEPVPPPDVPDYLPELEAVEQSDSDARWDTFEHEMHKCILCFACRNLCPACYCNACFTESSQPQWMGRTSDPADTMFFHLTRLLHLAGRCTGCGACVRGCPVNVNLRLYNDCLRKNVKEVFDFEAGLDPETEAPLSCFRLDDREDFIH